MKKLIFQFFDENLLSAWFKDERPQGLSWHSALKGMVHGLKYAEPSTAVSCQLNLIKHLIHNAQHTLVNVYSTVSNCDLDVDTKSGQETCNQLSHRRPSRSPRRGVARVWFCWYIRSLRKSPNRKKVGRRGLLTKLHLWVEPLIYIDSHIASSSV